MTELLRLRVDPELKAKSERVAKEMGLSLGEAVRLFMTQMVRRRELPFPVKAGSENDDILAPREYRARVLNSFYED
jgi:DNA-damage-inducible protein J